MTAAGPAVVLPWHAAAWRRLAGLRAGSRMPHAILLAGPAGLGKSQFARRLGASLVCARVGAEGDACGECAACRQVRAGSHADLHWIAPDEPGKLIKIDAIRALNRHSVLAAQEGGYRVFVIDSAEMMNVSAANALLKTLEEPASRTILVLVSSRPDRLPATIRSRCHAIVFAVPPTSDARDWLVQELPDGDVNSWLAIGGGAPLQATRAFAEGWLDADRQLIRGLGQLKERRTNPLQVVENLTGRPLTSVLESFRRCVADLVRIRQVPTYVGIFHPTERADLQSLAQDIDFKRLHEFGDELARFDHESRHNLNPTMVIEFLVNRWLQLTRPGGR